MTQFSKNTRRTATYFCALVIFAGYMGVLILIPTSASALTKAQALDVCERKVNIAACKTRVNKCAATDSACLNNAVRIGAGRATEGSSTGGGAAGGAVEKVTAGPKPSVAAERTSNDTCGNDPAVKVSIDFGCTGKGNPIVDMAYAFIKFLTYGVGLVLAASIIYAGIQYTSSSGNPEQTSAAKKRILNAFVALIFYLLIFSFVQFLVPGMLFK